MKQMILIFILTAFVSFGQADNILSKNVTFNTVFLNGYFDEDVSFWTKTYTAPTFEWVESGGGFRGALHVVTDAGNEGATSNAFSTVAKQYKFKFDLNIISKTANVLVTLVTSGAPKTWTFTTTGLQQVDTIITVGATSIGALYVVQQNVAGATEFYLDNVYLRRRDE